ncbi:MAG: endonuclease/exonuclease/phosphatase family protein [Alphaproteobacteria bacterium]
MFRVATFNLENLDDIEGAQPSLRQRLDILRPQMLRLQADVLCLQEVNSQAAEDGGRTLTALDVLISDTPYQTFHKSFSQGLSGTHLADKHNLVTLSRAPVLDYLQVRHDYVSPPEHTLASAFPGEPEEIVFDRPFLYTKVRLPYGHVLHVINAHLRAPIAAYIPGQKMRKNAWRSVSGWSEGYFLASVKRAAQALEIRLFIETLFEEDPQAMIIVCGDLNAEAHEDPIRILIAAEEDVENPSLTPRSLVPIEHGIPEDLRYSVIHHGRRQLLDRVLISRPLLAYYRGAEIHNESLEDEFCPHHASGDGTMDSHHAPFIASFDFSGLR